MVGGSLHCLGVLPAGEGPGGGTMIAEGPTRQPPLKPPLPARPWPLRLTIPRSGCTGFLRKAGLGGWWSLVLDPPP